MKKIVYGAIYATCWVFIFYGVYLFAIRPAPSCVDAVQNGDEEEVDCGGSFCVSCAIKKLKPVQIEKLSTLPSNDGSKTSILLELRNPNAAYGARTLNLDLAIYATGTRPIYTERVVTPLYPSELKYRLFINLPIAYSTDLRIAATSSNPVWASVVDLAKPRTPVREVRTVVTAALRRAVITGIIQNDNAYALGRITINGLAIADSKDIVGISKTVIQDINPKEERFFQLVIPFAEGVENPANVGAKITVEAER